jgi:AraC-like DNA-binding protein
MQRVHTLQSAPVTPSLREFVRAYAQRTVAWSGPDLVQPIPASLEHVLEFDFANPPEIEYPDGTRESAYRIAVVGPHTRPGINLRLNGAVQSFAIFFQPLGLWQLFRIPVSELTDRAYTGMELLGKATEEIWLRMAECASFEARVAIAESYLLERAAKASGRTPIMNAAVHSFQNRGAIRINELAHHCGLSVRHFERRFSGDFGMTPKLFARITRFQTALDAKLHSPQRSWLEIAHDFGYSDQMHMVRDFQGLSGASPGRIFSELGDTRPPALAASHHE